MLEDKKSLDYPTTDEWKKILEVGNSIIEHTLKFDTRDSDMWGVKLSSELRAFRNKVREYEEKIIKQRKIKKGEQDE